MTQAPRITVVEHSAELGRLLDLTLAESGYDARVLIEPADVVAAVREQPPALVILDVLPYGEEALRTLDDLRTDEETNAIPVVVVTTSPETADAARASYNVPEVLVKPFDLPALETAVRRALGMPMLHRHLPLTPHQEGILATAEQVLARHSREAIFRWVQRLKQQPPWSERDDLRLSELLNSVPVLIHALDVALHYPDPDAFFNEYTDEVFDRVREHARLRRAQGIPLSAVIREYAMLRDEIWRLLRTHLPDTIAASDVFDLEVINRTLDRIMQETIPTYTEVVT